jgi:hypothetical protein
MADSVDEEYAHQPSISKNANTFQPSGSGARTAEARRRSGRQSSEFLRDNASDAPPQKSFRQTAGLRDQSRTELRSSNQRRTAPGGIRFSRFQRAGRAHPRRSGYGNNGDTELREATRGDPRQVDRDTMSDRSYSDNSDTGGRMSEAAGNGTIKPKKPAPKHNKPGNWRNDSVIDGPDYMICTYCKRSVLKTSIKTHLISCSKRKMEISQGKQQQERKYQAMAQRGYFLPSSSNKDDSDDSDATSIFSTYPESSDGEVSSVRKTSSTRFPGIKTLREAYGASKSPNGTLSEASSLSLRFSSITNNTISKDKTQGVEACNSELLAAFGQKIQAHCFGKIPQESPNLEDSEEEISTTVFRGFRDVAVDAEVAVDAFTFQQPGFKSDKASSRPVDSIPRAPSSLPYQLPRMYVSGLPDGITADGFRRFVNRSNVPITSIKYATGDRAGSVEFYSYAGLRVAVEKLNGSEFRGARVTCSEVIGHV